ncbi:hypothetical protein [Lactococcus lactis]|uniref:hypothetical protein n=1 Tax=Lactococcus lactis TaxID=1358 RepID=UPI001D187CE0|nr:hypothetical protein [Lactococcus lactis]MCC4121693.1 hypothetical protein [Lactococcus lactis]MCL9640842.1 hypothetical protein [Lactococcus lactis]
MRRIIEIYNNTTFELSKLDIQKDPSSPVIRFCVRDKLVGIFAIETGKIVLDNGLTKFEYMLAEKEIIHNRCKFLQSWDNYSKFLEKI